MRYTRFRLSLLLRKHGLNVVLIGSMGLFLYAKVDADATLFQYPAYFGNRIYEPANNQATQEGIALGRLLFYEKRLSANNQVSCSTCHQQEKAFSDGRPLSLGIDGTPTPRNAMALVNLLWVKNYFWDGRVNSLEEQALVPLSNPHEMGQSLTQSAQKLQVDSLYRQHFQAAFDSPNITGPKICKALAQFERSLISANAPYDRYLRKEYAGSVSEQRGMAIFFGTDGVRRQGLNACSHCHGGPKLYTELYQDNGLDQRVIDPGRAALTGRSLDSGRFRVVTLRNIALTAPYMHDGRFATLEEVIDHYSEHIQASEHLSTPLRSTQQPGGYHFTKQEKKDLLAFLHMLTDSTFIQNPAFSDPFKSHNP